MWKLTIGLVFGNLNIVYDIFPATEQHAIKQFCFFFITNFVKLFSESWTQALFEFWVQYATVWTIYMRCEFMFNEKYILQINSNSIFIFTNWFPNEHTITNNVMYKSNYGIEFRWCFMIMSSYLNEYSFPANGNHNFFHFIP